MRLCFYTHSFLPLVGGAELVLHNLATHLAARGEDVVVMAPAMRRPCHDQDTGYTIHRFPMPSSKRWGVRQTLVPLAWQHWRHRFQVLHCHSGYPAAYVGATFKRLFHTPLVVRPHGADILPDGNTRRHPRLARRLRRALHAADAVIAQGRFLKEVILTLGVAEQRIHTIHNGVDLQRFASGIPYPHPRPYVLGVGKLMRHKGFDVLLRAYARLPRSAPDLLIAGVGAARESLQTLALELGIAPRVTFVGFVEGQTKTNLFRSAQCFICPSRREPFANVILEAFAAGVPVIASAVGGNVEQIHHGVHGFLFPSEDDVALAYALQQFLENPALQARMRASIPAWVHNFAWSGVVTRYLELYQELARRAEYVEPSRASGLAPDVPD